MIHEESQAYEVQGVSCKGAAFFDSSSTAKRPGVLVAHAWRGQDAFAKQKAEALAKLGYVGLAIDLYGNGQTADTDEKAFELMRPLFEDRRLLRQRIAAAYETLISHPLVDASRTGAIGFCFGGLSVIELLRSGAGVKGVVAFHAVLGDAINGLKARLEPSKAQSNASILLLHGFEDPLVTSGEIEALEQELTKAGVDWQFHTYGHTVHAFTNPEVHAPGMQFNPKANNRAFLAMKNFFAEIL